MLESEHFSEKEFHFYTEYIRFPVLITWTDCRWSIETIIFRQLWDKCHCVYMHVFIRYVLGPVFWFRLNEKSYQIWKWKIFSFCKLRGWRTAVKRSERWTARPFSSIEKCTGVKQIMAKKDSKSETYSQYVVIISETHTHTRSTSMASTWIVICHLQSA